MSSVLCAFAVLLALLLPAASAKAQAVVLGPALELGDFAIRPPAGFWPLEVVGEDTAALAPGWPGARRELLVAMLREPDVLFAVSQIHDRWEGGAGAPDRIARAVLDEARESLDVDVGLLWADRLADGGVQLAGRYQLAGRARELLFAFVPMEDRTVVVALAGPAEVIQGLASGFEAVLRTLEPLDGAQHARRRTPWLVAMASLVGGGTIAALQRRRELLPSKRRAR